MIALLSFGFASCSNEDDNGWKPIQSASEIQGVWVTTSTATGGLCTMTYTFTGNKWNKEEYYHKSNSTVKNHGTFVVSKGKITFKYEYSVEVESKDWTTSIEIYEDERNTIWLNIGGAKYYKK